MGRKISGSKCHQTFDPLLAAAVVAAAVVVVVVVVLPG